MGISDQKKQIKPAKNKRILVAVLVVILILVCVFAVVTQIVARSSYKYSDLCFNLNPNNYQISKIDDNKYSFRVADIDSAGDICINCGSEDFHDLGYSFGDSVDLVFENGLKLSDIPYYSCEHFIDNSTCVHSSTCSTYIWICANDKGLAYREGVLPGDNVIISINTRYKYFENEYKNSLKLNSSESNYGSREDYVNYYAIESSRIQNNALFRSCCPFNDDFNRSYITDKSIRERHFQYIYTSDYTSAELSHLLDLNYNDYRVKYYQQIFDNQGLACCKTSSNLTNEENFENCAKMLSRIAEFDPPYLIACDDGFASCSKVCLILQCLMACSYDEMREDFIHPYEIHYNVTQSRTPEVYDSLINTGLNSVLSFYLDIPISEVAYTNPIYFKEKMEDHLTRVGVSSETIKRIQSKLAKK